MSNIPIEVSARHIHLTAADWATISALPEPTVARQISQPPQFVGNERFTIAGPAGDMHDVAFVGPFRAYTQVELSLTDARRLGLQPPLRMSGQLTDAAMISIAGPRGSISVPAAVIQQRHIHCNAAEAAELGVVDQQEVSVVISSSRGGRLDHVMVRIDPTFRLTLHLDTDEANALGIDAASYATLAV